MIAPVTSQVSSATSPSAGADEAARQRLQTRPEPTQPPSARVSLSTEAASPSRESAPQTSDSTASSSSTDLRYYDPADADKNGEVGEFEQQAYDYRHPASLAEQQLEQQRRAELRVYAEVAAAGRPAATRT